jgi:thiol-disulfide isomerase/thioredoxin
LRFESQVQQENLVTFTLGPLVLQASHILLALLFCVAAGVGRFAGRRKKIGISSVLLDMALAALAAGRIGFVLTRLRDFRAAPWWTVFDIRDGGSYLPAAFAGALAMAVWRCWRKPDLRMPLAAGLLAALFAWDLGGAAIAFKSPLGAAAPAMALHTPDGAATDFKTLAGGKPMVVNFWASWCPPCRHEMPVLAGTQQERADVAFVFVNADAETEAGVRFLRERHFEVRNVVGDPLGEVARAVGTSAFPTTLFYGADGKLASLHIGELSQASLNAYLEKIAAPR